MTRVLAGHEPTADGRPATGEDEPQTIAGFPVSTVRQWLREKQSREEAIARLERVNETLEGDQLRAVPFLLRYGVAHELDNLSWTDHITIYELCFNAVKQLYSDWVTMDSKMMYLSLAIIKARPSLYAKWLVKAFPIAVILVLTDQYVLNLLALLLVLLLVIWHALYVLQRLRSGPVTGGNRSQRVITPSN